MTNTRPLPALERQLSSGIQRQKQQAEKGFRGKEVKTVTTDYSFKTL